jgi:hypothetical protein
VKLAWLFALLLVAGAGTVPHADAQAPLPLVAILEQPTRISLIVNQKTAKALGIVLPPVILLRADQIIE